MRHFHRTHLVPADVVVAADEFFATLGMTASPTGSRSRSYSGPLGAMTLLVRPEGGHYTFVEANTDQIGESRLDKNVKKFFVALHRRADPSHKLTAGY
jgi:hypothetical protein